MHWKNRSYTVFKPKYTFSLILFSYITINYITLTLKEHLADLWTFIHIPKMGQEIIRSFYNFQYSIFKYVLKSIANR